MDNPSDSSPLETIADNIVTELDQSPRPLDMDQLSRLLKLKSAEDLARLADALQHLCDIGQLKLNRNMTFALVKDAGYVKGTVQGHRDGFGFLRTEGDDYFIPVTEMHRVLHGDVILARVGKKDRKGRTEVRVEKVLEPRKEPIVGRYFTEHGMGFVVPDDARICQDIMVLKEHNAGARQGNVVVVEITKRPNKRVNGVGKIIEVLGESMAPGMEIDIALRTYEIPHQWPKSILTYIKRFSEEVPESAKTGRKDLRSIPLVTIDGEDARDFDDAVYCEPTKNGWKLYVAIADVSYYVKHGCALDDEALNRGNSVYFPEQVVPMLPEILSNGLCSLNPNVDRLCMVCEMEITHAGELEHYEFYEGLMNSHARLTYTKVAKILDGDEELRERYQPLIPHIEDLQKLFLGLKARRRHRGAIEFETDEARFIFNAQRKIEHIVPLERNQAHMLIEECMILANVATARFLEKHQIHGLFRVHESPEQSRLINFTNYLAEVGIEHKLGNDPEPSEFASVLEKVEGRPDKEVIQTMLLRTMQQAHYNPENLGHFGLALPAYSHFTSPIRRYPDLVVHRAIKAQVAKMAKKKSKSGGFAYNDDEVSNIGEQCSMTERRAEQAVRDVVNWLKCEFMLDHVGSTYQGVVATVTNFGLFVRIPEFHIEGLVHITSLKSDFYHFDDTKQRLIGEHSGNIYRMGDPLVVKVAAVNLDERKIDFIIEGDEQQKSMSKREMLKRGKIPGKDFPKGKKGSKKPIALDKKSKSKDKGRSKGKKTAKKRR